MRAESLPIGVRRPPLQRKKQKSIQLLALLDNDLAHAQTQNSRVLANPAELLSFGCEAWT